MTLNDHLLSQPTHWLIWVGIMVIMNFGAIFFAWKDVRARWVVIAMLANAVFMNALFLKFGYTRILGFSHVVFWTPLVAYLWKNRQAFPERHLTNKFLWGVMIVNTLSLLIDYTDVIRYVLGDRGPL